MGEHGALRVPDIDASSAMELSAGFVHDRVADRVVCVQHSPKRIVERADLHACSRYVVEVAPIDHALLRPAKVEPHPAEPAKG